MATFAVHKAIWNSFSEDDRVAISNLDEYLALGIPAEFKEDAIRWLIFDDHRFTILMVGRLGVVFANLGKMRRSRAELDKDIVMPVYIDHVDLWPQILDAQRAPATIRMMSRVPDSWTPVGGDV